MSRQPVIVTRESFASYGRSRGRKKRSKEYDLTPSKDGIPRMTVQVEFRLTLHDLATAIVSAIAGNQAIQDHIAGKTTGPIQPIVIGMVRTKRQAIDLARLELAGEGADNYHYRVSDNNFEWIAKALLPHLEQLWKE